MKNSASISLFILLIFLFACQQKELVNLQDSSEVASEIAQIWSEYTEALKNGDIDKVMSYNTQDFINYPAYGVTQVGFEETKSFLKDFIETNTFSESLRAPKHIEVIVHGDFAFEVAEMEFTVTPENGETTVIKQRSFSTFKRQSDGSWKFHRWIGQPLS